MSRLAELVARLWPYLVLTEKHHVCSAWCGTTQNMTFCQQTIPQSVAGLWSSLCLNFIRNSSSSSTSLSSQYSSFPSSSCCAMVLHEPRPFLLLLQFLDAIVRSFLTVRSFTGWSLSTSCSIPSPGGPEYSFLTGLLLLTCSTWRP